MSFEHAESIPPHASAANAAWHPLNGLPLGHLRGAAPGTDVVITVACVVEEAGDLAVADRVAFVCSTRTGTDHVVLAGHDRYLVASVSPSLDWAAAMRLIPAPDMPRLVSVACADGILPILRSA